MALQSFTIMYHFEHDPYKIYLKAVLTSSKVSALQFVRAQHPTGVMVVRYVVNTPPTHRVLGERHCEFCGQTSQRLEKIPRQVYPGELERDSHLWQRIEP